MSVVALVTVSQWSDAQVAATMIDTRPWLAHLCARLAHATAVARVVVVCHPECLRMVAPHVPGGVALVSATDARAWAATAEAADVVAVVPVWQLFADPARLDDLAAVPRSKMTARVRAVDEHDQAIDLTGGAFVELLTRRGCEHAAAGLEPSATEQLTVPRAPEPPELRLDPGRDVGWGVTLQRALHADGQAHDLNGLSAVLSRAGLRRFDFWRDGVGVGPRAVLTIRCLPAAAFTRLLEHLRSLPSTAIDVLCPESLAEATAALPGVRRVITFAGPAFDLARLPVATLAAIRERGYGLCVVPRRTPCGRGFDNVTPLGAASGAALAVWMDLTGATGVLGGLPRGWEPWVTEAPPWADVAAWRERAATALQGFGSATEAAAGVIEEPAVRARATAWAIVARLDEYVSCQALVDNPDAGLELAPLLLHQIPPVLAAHAAVAHLQAAARPAATRLGAVVDRVLEHGVAVLCEVEPGADDGGRSDVARQAATALGALATRVVVAGDGTDDEAEALALGDALARTMALVVAGDTQAIAQMGRA
jgi:hypothetical protein